MQDACCNAAITAMRSGISSGMPILQLMPEDMHRRLGGPCGGRAQTAPSAAAHPNVAGLEAQVPPQCPWRGSTSASTHCRAAGVHASGRILKSRGMAARRLAGVNPPPEGRAAVAAAECTPGTPAPSGRHTIKVYASSEKIQI